MAEQKMVSRIFLKGNMINPKTKEKYKVGEKVELSEANAKIFKDCFEKVRTVEEAAAEAAEAEAKAIEKSGKAK